MTIELPFRPLPIDQQDVRYAYGPDSDRKPGVPAGSTVEFDWCESTIYPGTTRRYWVHVPAQYDPSEPASLMVFQDGWWYLDPDGQVRGAIVLDNLIHRDEIPVTIGVFVDPGVLKNAEQSKNRNAEYDAFDDRYVTFLLTEIIPRSHGATRSPRTPTNGASAEAAAAATAPSRLRGCARTSSGESSATSPASRRCRTETRTLP